MGEDYRGGTGAVKAIQTDRSVEKHDAASRCIGRVEPNLRQGSKSLPGPRLNRPFACETSVLLPASPWSDRAGPVVEGKAGVGRMPTRHVTDEQRSHRRPEQARWSPTCGELYSRAVEQSTALERSQGALPAPLPLSGARSLPLPSPPRALPARLIDSSSGRKAPLPGDWRPHEQGASPIATHVSHQAPHLASRPLSPDRSRRATIHATLARFAPIGRPEAARGLDRDGGA